MSSSKISATGPRLRESGAKEVEIDGKMCYYTDQDRWFIDIGRYTKGSYKVRNVFDSPVQAVLHFNAINIGYGYKKRLRLNNKVIARAAS